MHIINVKTIAIIEREYLIAIDLQRIIEENFECEVQIILPSDAIEKLQDLKVDLLLLDAEIAPLLVSKILEVRPTAEGSVVFLTLDDFKNTRDLPISAAAIVSKPFTDEQIVQAVTASIMRTSV